MGAESCLCKKGTKVEFIQRADIHGNLYLTTGNK